MYGTRAGFKLRAPQDCKNMHVCYLRVHVVLIHGAGHSKLPTFNAAEVLPRFWYDAPSPSHKCGFSRSVRIARWCATTAPSWSPAWKECRDFLRRAGSMQMQGYFLKRWYYDPSPSHKWISPQDCSSKNAICKAGRRTAETL